MPRCALLFPATVCRLLAVDSRSNPASDPPSLTSGLLATTHQSVRSFTLKSLKCIAHRQSRYRALGRQTLGRTPASSFPSVSRLDVVPPHISPDAGRERGENGLRGIRLQEYATVDPEAGRLPDSVRALANPVLSPAVVWTPIDLTRRVRDSISDKELKSVDIATVLSFGREETAEPTAGA